jgi:hypothetical protein
MSESENIWYCADVLGKQPGETVTLYQYGDDYNCAFVTSRQDVARAVAAGREDRTVYRVKGEGLRYDVPEDGMKTLEFAVFDNAVVIARVPLVSTSREALWEPIAQHFRWCDGSPRYDQEGYATSPPGMRGDTVPEQALRKRLKQGGKYLPPDMVGELTQVVAKGTGYVPPERGYC